MKFLVVASTSSERRIIINSLIFIGFEDIDEAENGEVALSKIKGVDFVITYWNMSVMSGLKMTNKIRTTIYPQLPILMVATHGGFNFKGDIIEALQAGVNNYIIKPFNPQVLKEKIDQILKN